ncbi:hypothetical protein OAN12_07170, partial [Halioglobus sp.]|nr:hypothetical protein [Halioglobus sp.]
MRNNLDLKLARGFGLAVALLTATTGSHAYEVDRTHLPIAEPDPPKFKELDVRNVETPPLFNVE